MSFLLAPHETPAAGLSRAMREQADKLLGECGEAKENSAAFAHKARVRTKKIRAALRLARPMLGAKTYRLENRWWRDAARKLSLLRDAGARLEALDSLKPFLIARIGSAMTRRLGERFEKEQRAVASGEAIEDFRKHLTARGSELTPHLPSATREEMAEALGAGYRVSRRAMKAALKDHDPLLLHEWRKQTKFHALQARLMRLMFPEALEERHIAARDLAELLGAVQDIEVVLEGVKDWEEAPSGFEAALEARRETLIAEARSAGELLFAHKPKAWTRLLAPPETVG